MARFLGRSGPLWRFLLRPALIAVPIAFFFHATRGFRQGAFDDYLVVSFVFAIVITLCIEANTRWVRPRLVRREGSDPGRGHLLEVGSYGAASLVGSMIAALILQFTIAPGILGSPRVFLVVLVWSLLFGALFLAANYAFVFHQRYVSHVVAVAEARAREDQEMKTAAAIQQALLPPRFFVAPSCTAAGASIPCRTIGGDFFDYFDLGSRRTAFALGDVAGKGPPAAILAAMVQGLFTSNVGPDVPPAETVDRLNRALLRRAIEARFATLFYGCLDADGRLVTCNAGHNPGFLFRAQGALERLDEGGLMIGAFESAAYAEQETALGPGDTLVLYSDGVTDAESPAGEQFGEARLLSCLDRARMAPPAVILDQVLESVHSFVAGHPPADDVTVVVVRYGADIRGASASRTTS